MPRLGSSSVSSHYPSSTESLLELPTGSQRVKYRGAGAHSEYDFALETDRRTIDVSLVLPHYRARSQPLDHRMKMYVGNDSSDAIKIKVCRNFTPSRPPKFQLEVHSSSNADVTIWLPSDFKGLIHRSSSCKKVSFSSGFTNRIMQNVCLTQSRRPSVISISESAEKPLSNPNLRFADIYISEADPYGREKWNQFGSPLIDEDEVVIHTAGSVTFRMWDIRRGIPEIRCKEACKRMFGLGWCAKKSPEVAIDWDFLLED